MRLFQFFAKVLFFSLITITLSCVLKSKSEAIYADDGSVTTKNITQERDMTQYEQAGNFYSRWKSDSRENGEKKVRDFIWQHWTEKKRGYIKLSSMGTDTSTTSHYFIEPDEKGIWQIARRKVYKHGLPEYDNQPIIDDFVVVERANSKKDADDWQVLFKTKDGKELDSLPNLY